MYPQILRYHFQCFNTEKQISREEKGDLKFEFCSIITNFTMPYVSGTFLFWKTRPSAPMWSVLNKVQQQLFKQNFQQNDH